MSTKKTIICDRCNKKLTGSEELYKRKVVMTGESYLYDDGMEEERFKFDLCLSCSRLVYNFINNKSKRKGDKIESNKNS